MSNVHKHMFAASLWAVSIVLMVIQTINLNDKVLGCWSLLVALWACVFTGQLMLTRERLNLERLAEIMAAEMVKEQERQAEAEQTTRIH